MSDYQTKIDCPQCGEKYQQKDFIRCRSCGYSPSSNKELWKSSNLGKQRGKPKANRSGKR